MRPHNRELDENEPTFDGKQVFIIPAVKQALAAFADAGFLAAHHDYALGGIRLPQIIVQACQAYFQAANIATSSYSFLTGAAANVIQHFGSDEQKQRFLAPMLDGRYTGTMALTEPHAGSSLGICAPPPSRRRMAAIVSAATRFSFPAAITS